MSTDHMARPDGPGSRPSDRTPSGFDHKGFDPSRTAAPIGREEIELLLAECHGWHAALSPGACGDGAFTIRCENGESEQTRLNLRAWLRDVGTVLAGILSRDASAPQAPPASVETQTEGGRT